MPDTTDPAASALDEIRERGYHNGARGALCARLSDAAAVDIPRLLAAVEAALAFHEEFDGTCGSCLDAYGDHVAWPCEEFTDITAALAGKEAGDG